MGFVWFGDKEVAVTDFMFNIVDAEDSFAGEGAAGFVKRMGMQMVSPPTGFDDAPVNHFRFEGAKRDGEGKSVQIFKGAIGDSRRFA